jgi:predicted enzyme related to lactoylglutathione lyase
MMSGSASRFVWYELMTTDPASARDFYGKVIGWGAREAMPAPHQYTLFTLDGGEVAGLMALPDEARTAGARPGWIGYVGVPAVDAALAGVLARGGRQHVPPTDIPEVGRFAVVADPQGAVFTLFTPLPGMEAPAPPPMAPGRVAWHELHANDHAAAFDFYGDMFGWTKADALQIEGIGTYQLFAIGDMTAGGMFTPPGSEHPFWLFYVAVSDIDAALARVTQAGGAVLHGPAQVPGGAWIVQATDPQGALFALVGMRPG